MILTTILFILILGLFVFVHELGHFLAAKSCGIKVLEFAFGFPPRIWSKKRGETEYSINAIPIGGYVKMLGEADESKNPRSFSQKSPLIRGFVSVAGVIMNLLLAWLILAIGFAVGISPIVSSPDSIPGKIVSSSVIATEIENDSPAKKAGISAGDELISGQSVGEAIVSFSSSATLVNFTKTHAGKDVGISYNRGGKISNATVYLSANSAAPLGVGVIENSVVQVPWYLTPIVAFREVVKIVEVNLSFIGKFFVQLFSSGSVSKDVGGPVAIYVYTGLAAKAGVMVFLQFVAILSIGLAIINIIPFPALDGGRLLFIILEKIFRRKVLTERVENIFHNVGFALILLFAAVVTYRDVVNFIIKK
ncbi:MAG: site-2 protease family protein [Candidatus Berkelbacteria bacterium]|nr:site-2 protease family protein [Candidatus Berkelbacteria bacterium]